MEESLRRALLLSHGNPAVFFTRPISGVILVLAVVALAAATLPSI